MPNDYPEHHLSTWITQNSDLVPFLKSQSEKLSEIKAPLGCTKIMLTPLWYGTSIQSDAIMYYVVCTYLVVLLLPSSEYST